MKNRLIRDSNYELLRIISMLFIVTWHVIIHGKLIEQTTGAINFVMNAIILLVIVHVSLFMLITGYYQSQSKLKLKKIINLILEIWFYNFIINTVLYITGLIEYSNIEYLCKISFFDFTSYWYIQCYLIIYLLSPFINRYINSCSRVELKKVILVLLCCFSFIPFITGNLSYKTTGFTVSQYLVLYLVGAYIRKYDLNNTFISKFNKNQKRLIYIVIFIMSWVINLMMYYFSTTLISFDSNILNYFGNTLLSFKYFYSNPFVIIQAISIFMFFGTLNFKNKFINNIGTLMLGVYLIHEADGLKYNMYSWLGIDKGKMIYSNYIFVKMIESIILIFVCCILIEFVRKLIFNLLFKLKFIKKIESKLVDVIKNITEIK